MGRTLNAVRPFLCAGALLALGFARVGPVTADHGAAAHTPEQRVSHRSAGWPIGPFTLSDQRGGAFTQERLQGRWTFVLLGDTHCVQACGAALSALAGLTQRIARTDAVKTTQVLFVSLDPDRDTPQRLREYLTAFDSGFVGATGSRQALEQLADEIGATGAAAASYRGSLVLIGPDGVVRVEYLPPFDTKRLTAEYLKTRARG